MRLQGLWTTLGRRWYLTLVALMLAAGATFSVVTLVGPTYEADGSVLVFPPVATVQRETQEEAQSNPYLVLNGVSQARDIVIRALTSKSTRDDLANEYPGSTFEATPDFTNSAPIILVTAKADSAADATAALQAVMSRVPQILDDLQSGLNLPPDAVITSRPLLADASPDPVYSGQIRAGIVAGVVALGLGLLLVGLVDGLLSGRGGKKQARRRPRREASGGASSTVAAPEAEARTGHERVRRLGPRAPVRSQPGVRSATTGEAPEALDRSISRRLRSVSVEDETIGPSEAARA